MSQIIKRIQIYSLFWMIVPIYFIIPVLRSSTECPKWIYYLDQFIPFVGWMVIPYYTYYLMFIIPPFIIKNNRRVKLLTNLLIKLTLFCYFIYLIWPISSDLILSQVDDGPLSFFHSSITFDFLYQNAFPSMHVAVAVIIGYAIAYEYPKQKIISYLWVLGIFMGTFLIKQHYVLDSISGLIIALPACYYYRKCLA